MKLLDACLICCVLIAPGCSTTEKITSKRVESPDVNAKFQTPKTNSTEEHSKLSQENPEHGEAAKLMLSKIKTLLASGKKMQPIRANLEDCSEQMRQNQKEVSILRTQALSAPPDSVERIYLAPAAIDLSLCVSCSDGLANEACDRVASAVQDAEQVIQ